MSISEILEVATLISMGGFEAGASGWASIERPANAAEPPSKSLKARRDTAVGVASYETLRSDRFSQPHKLTA